VIFFLVDNNFLLRWAKRVIFASIFIFAFTHLGREFARTLTTVAVICGVGLALAASSSSPKNNSSKNDGAFANTGDLDSGTVDNDPYSQNNIHNPLFHQSDFNSNHED
jgi:hypothetical protein